MKLSEFELIDRISNRVSEETRVELGIGDDCAVVRGRGRVVTSVDTAVAGVHFQADRPARESAWKAVASAVSDLAAMGLGEGMEAEVLVALGVPAETEDEYLEGLIDGVAESAAEFGVLLVGGDVVSAPVPFLSVTAMAHVTADAPVITRSGARPGDVVALTGAVGGAAAGLALIQGTEISGISDLSRSLLVESQVRPRPALAAAPVLARSGATAMIDVSDGLAADLGHIASASKVGIHLNSDEIPVVPGASEVFTALGFDPLEAAVTGGEDYVLAVTLPSEQFAEADSALIEATGFELLAIGSVVAGEADEVGKVVFRSDDGAEFRGGGHDHFRSSGLDSR